MQPPLLGAQEQLPGSPASTQDVEGGGGQASLSREADALHQRKRFAVYLAPWGALAESWPKVVCLESRVGRG